MKTIVKKLMKSLIEKKLTVAFAESVTCGLACNQLNSTPGTSEVLMGGIVCYNEKVKINLLNVKPSIIKKYTAESQETTDAIAKNLKQLIDADIYVGITGLDADGGSETPDKPVGTVFFSMYYKGKFFRLHKVFKGKPLEIKKSACEEAYKLILQKVGY